MWLPWEVRPWWPRTGQHSREPMHSAQGPQNHRDTQGCSFLQQCGGYRSWCQEGETASLWPCHGEDGDTRYGIRTTGSGGDLELPFCRVPCVHVGCGGSKAGRSPALGSDGQGGSGQAGGCQRPAYFKREGKLKLVGNRHERKGPQLTRSLCACPRRQPWRSLPATCPPRACRAATLPAGH